MKEENAIVFVVDDDMSMRESLRNLIRSAGLRVQTFSSAQEFLASQRPKAPSCLVLDVQLPGLSGLDLQQELAKANIQIPIIFLTGHGDIPMSVRAIKAGALEFLTKPFDDEDLLGAIQQGIARDQRAPKQREDIAEHKFGDIVGTSAPLRNVAQSGRGCRADGIDSAASRRDGHGKGTYCAGGPQRQFPFQSSLRQAQLRGNPLRVIGKRVVWP